MFISFLLAAVVFAVEDSGGCTFVRPIRLGDSMINNQDDDGRIRTYWIPEPGDDDPLAGAIRLPQGGDWFNCMASDVEALSELVAATGNGN